MCRVPGAAYCAAVVVVVMFWTREAIFHDPTSSDIRKTVNRKREVEASRQPTHPYKLGFQHSIIIIRHVGHYFFVSCFSVVHLSFHIWNNDATTEN